MSIKIHTQTKIVTVLEGKKKETETVQLEYAVNI